MNVWKNRKEKNEMNEMEKRTKGKIREQVKKKRANKKKRKQEGIVITKEGMEGEVVVEEWKRDGWKNKSLVLRI